MFGCGDLPFYYLEFVATVLKAPVLVVYGNHDISQLSEDGSDVAYRGFMTLRAFVRLFRPALMVHGHLHLWQSDIRQETQVGSTMVMNVYPVKLIHWPLA